MTVEPRVTAAADKGVKQFNKISLRPGGWVFSHLHAAGVEGLVSKLLLQGRHHSTGVQLPPVQEEAGMCGGVGDVSRNPLGLGVVRVAPRLVLPEKMHHFGVLTEPETRIKPFTLARMGGGGGGSSSGRVIPADSCANKHVLISLVQIPDLRTC